jgi:hypothetical protein
MNPEICVSEKQRFVDRQIVETDGEMKIIIYNENPKITLIVYRYHYLKTLKTFAFLQDLIVWTVWLTQNLWSLTHQWKQSWLRWDAEACGLILSVNRPWWNKIHCQLNNLSFNEHNQFASAKPEVIVKKDAFAELMRAKPARATWLGQYDSHSNQWSCKTAWDQALPKKDNPRYKVHLLCTVSSVS